MFLNLFYGLRDEGIPVGMQEWMTLVEALKKGLHGSSLYRFYHLSRACLVKSESYFDAFDRVFLRIFKDVEGSLDGITQELLDWLSDPKSLPELTPEQLAELERLSHDELMRRFMETLAELTERHDGGGKWVGTGGRSPRFSAASTAWISAWYPWPPMERPAAGGLWINPFPLK